MTRLSFTSGFLAWALAFVAFASAVVLGQGGADEAKLLERVRALQKQTPLIDGHNDLPWAMRENVWYDFTKFDIRQPQAKLHTDIPRVRQGGLGGQFWSVYVPAELQGEHAVSATMEQIDAVYELVRRYPDTFELARTADDVERIFKKGKVASLIGMEGGHSIDNSMATLRMFARLGAGYMTLTHGKNLAWADSATDEPKLHGLSKFGEEVVREMNRLGMLVDLSHVSPETMEDAIRVSAAPVIFSHSSARALCDVPRNVPDSVLQQLPKNGGVIMVTFVPGFISPEVVAYNKQLGEQQKASAARHPNDGASIKADLEAWIKANPEPRATVSQIADHVDHIKKIAGIDHIGIGSDFDGITSVPAGLEDTSKYPALFAELLRRGYTDADVQKIMGRNILRVMRQAEAVAKKLQTERSPSLARLVDLDGPQSKAETTK
jgi:membrane dipeptidase